MEEKFQESKVEGRNAVLEAFRSGRVVDKLFSRWRSVKTVQFRPHFERSEKTRCSGSVCKKGTSLDQMSGARKAPGCHCP